MSLDEIISRHSDAGSAAETAYRSLREAILTRTFAPGSRLRADQLAKQFGMSKTPVREALQKLQAEDLVTVNAGNQLNVKLLTESELIEIYYTREALEGMAARLAAGNAGQMELFALKGVLEDLDAAHSRGDLKAAHRLSSEFQLALYRASRNAILIRLLKNLQEQVHQYPETTLSLEGRADEMTETYRRLFGAIERRDEDEAERIARANRRRTLELRLRMLRNAEWPQA